MIREVFLLAPKKSSKTSYAAALMETTLLMNQRPRAEFLLGLVLTRSRRHP